MHCSFRKRDRWRILPFHAVVQFRIPNSTSSQLCLPENWDFVLFFALSTLWRPRYSSKSNLKFNNSGLHFGRHSIMAFYALIFKRIHRACVIFHHDAINCIIYWKLVTEVIVTYSILENYFHFTREMHPCGFWVDGWIWDGANSGSRPTIHFHAIIYLHFLINFRSGSFASALTEWWQDTWWKHMHE